MNVALLARALTRTTTSFALPKPTAGAFARPTGNYVNAIAASAGYHLVTVHAARWTRATASTSGAITDVDWHWATLIFTPPLSVWCALMSAQRISLHLVVQRSQPQPFRQQLASALVARRSILKHG